MKLQHVLIALSLVAVAFASVPTSATHETSDCTPTASEPTVQEEGYAVFADEVAGDNYLFSVWIYQESNGLDGIQRDDSYTQDPNTAAFSDEDCGHGADRIVF